MGRVVRITSLQLEGVTEVEGDFHIPPGPPCYRALQQTRPPGSGEEDLDVKCFKCETMALYWEQWNGVECR